MLLACAPRVAVGERGVLWADAHGFDADAQAALAARALVLLGNRGLTGARAAVAETPIAAELAARAGHGNTPETRAAVVAPGTDRAFVALFPIGALDPSPHLVPLLFSIGVATCGEMAALESEAVEVRLGAEGVALWRLARADDRRRDALFSSVARELPHASLDWVEYALKDPARLLFVVNSLLERVCGDLIASGRGAREITLEFALTDRSVRTHPLRAARPTANRRTWIRLARTALDTLTLPAAVTGIAVRAARVTEQEAKQGDLFDRGLGSAQATEDAVARLVEDQGEVVLVPENSSHPLLDARARNGRRHGRCASRPLRVSRAPKKSIRRCRTSSSSARPRRSPSRWRPRRDATTSCPCVIATRRDGMKSHRPRGPTACRAGSGTARTATPASISAASRARAGSSGSFATHRNAGATGTSTAGGTDVAPYVELRAHTGFSFGDGSVTPETLVKQAIKLGYGSIGITDTADLGGLVRAVVEAREDPIAGEATRWKLRIIAGAELRVAESRAGGDRCDGHPVAFLARDVTGYRNLAGLVTQSRVGTWSEWTQVQVGKKRGHRERDLGAGEGAQRRPARAHRPGIGTARVAGACG